MKTCPYLVVGHDGRETFCLRTFSRTTRWWVGCLPVPSHIHSRAKCGSFSLRHLDRGTGNKSHSDGRVDSQLFESGLNHGIGSSEQSIEDLL